MSVVALTPDKIHHEISRHISQGVPYIDALVDYAEKNNVEIETIGESMEQEAVFGSVEAVKTVSDLFLPMSGEIIEFNEALESNPELVNNDPYGEGWMVKVRVSNPSEFEALLDASAYGQEIH